MASKTSIQRRTFMAALGLGIAAPLAARMASRVQAAQSDAPVRLLNIYIPNGIPWERANPVVYADPKNPWATGTIDLMQQGADGILAPLAPWQDYFTCVRGLEVEGVRDHDATLAMLNGSASATNSIDYLIAQELGVTPYVLGISAPKGSPLNNFSNLCNHGGTYVRARENPVTAASEIFAGLGSGGTETEAENEAKFRSDLMDLTSRQIEGMQAAVRGLTSEEVKLQTHLNALADIKELKVSSTLSCTERPVLPLVTAAEGLDHADITNWRATFDAHLELAGYAMVCGAAPVLTIQAMSPSTDYQMGFSGGPGVSGGYHGVSHGGRESIATIQRWVFQRIAESLLPLLDVEDPSASDGSTVLDNSIIYITTEVSDPNMHASHSGVQSGTSVTSEAYEFNGSPAYNGASVYGPLPNLLIGTGAGYFKKGGVDISLPQSSAEAVAGSGRPHADLLVTIADAMRTNVTDLGGSRTIIEELKA